MTFSSSIRGALIARCVTAGVSTLCSFLLVVFISQSETGLKSPYSRIIFGLSIADVLQSIGIFASPFAAPVDPQHIFGRGNVQSCSAVGFFTIAGSLAVPLYTLHLTYYFLKRVKYKVKPQDFANGQEKWLHIIIWMYSIVVPSLAAGKGMINPMRRGAMCYLGPSPTGCNTNDEIECIRGKGAHLVGAILIVLPLAAIFVALLTVLGAFTLHVYTSEKQLQPTKQGTAKKAEEKEIDDSPNEESDDSPREVEVDENKEPEQNQQEELSAFQRYEKQALKLVLTKSAIFQSSLYIFAFLLVYSGPLLGIGSGMIPNELVVWWFSVFYPLGGETRLIHVHFTFAYKAKQNVDFLIPIMFSITGLFNILIYTRPKVQALRKIIDISRFMGFIVVVVAGGETPNVMDYISADHQQDDDNHSISPSRNSALERVCKALGYDFGDDFDIDAEVQRVMRGDYGEDRNAIQNARISNENSSVFVESNAKIYNSGKESGKDGLSSCLSITNETFQDDNAA